MPSLADLRQKYPTLDGLDDDQTVDAVHQAFYPDLSREQVAGSLGVKPPPPPAPTRSLYGAMKDSGAGILQGVAGLAKTGGELYGLASGDLNNPVSTAADNVQKYFDDSKSDYLKDKLARRDAAIKDAGKDGGVRGALGEFGTAIKESVTDPALMADLAFTNIATMIPGLGVGKATMAALAARGALKGAVVTGAEKAALEEAALKLAASRATAASVGTGAVQQAADVSQQAYDDAQAKTPEQLAQNPEFVRRVQAGEDPAAVQRSLGLSAARAAFVPAGVISAAANAIPGGTVLERALIGGAAKDTIKAGTKFGLAKSVAKGALGEASTEALEEGGGQFSANLANQKYTDPNQNLLDQVGNNAGMGAAGGIAMGGPAGLFHSNKGTHSPVAPPGDQLREQKLPDTGPLSRGVNAGLDAKAERLDSGDSALVSPDHLVTYARDRLDELTAKSTGAPEQTATDAAGAPVVTAPAIAPQELTADEAQEVKALTPIRDDPKALARHFDVELGTPQPLAAPAAGILEQAIAPQVDQAAPAAPVVEPVAQDESLAGALAPPLADAVAAPIAEAETPAAIQTEPATPSQPAAQPLAPAPVAAPAAQTSAPLVDDTSAAAAFTQREADRPAEVQGAVRDGDILNKRGQPFTTMPGAMTALRSAGDGHEIARVADGLVVRPTASAAPTVDATTQPAQQLVINQPATAANEQVDATPAKQTEPSQAAASNKPAGPASETPAVSAAGPSAVQADGRPDLIEHTTTSGETVRGVIRPDLTRQDARAIDPGAFKLAARKNQPAGFFIREQRLDALAKFDGNPKAAAADPAVSLAPAAAPGAPSTAADAKPPARVKPKVRAVKASEQETERARADYFTPGNIVQGYGGADRVVSYRPATEDKPFEATVQRVEKQGDIYVVPRNEPERKHGTQPDARALKAGPIERAPVAATASESTADAPAFSRSRATESRNALDALSKNDSLFALPRPASNTVAGIASEIDPGITVRLIDRVGGDTYALDLPDDTRAKLTVRPQNPYGPSVYGYKLNNGEISDRITERPGANADEVDPTAKDVYIDVSTLKSGELGVEVYAIAAGLAHNTGSIFIGDPAGLSDDAMVRRPEQMLSSALKYGTTAHLAPHPRQVDGDASIGVPPLDWVYGDHEGNIQRLIDHNLAVQDNAGYGSLVKFDPATNEFTDASGRSRDAGGLAAIARTVRESSGAAVGRRTLARAAVLRSLVREQSGSVQGADGQRGGLLARLAELGNSGAPNLDRIFYSRASVPGEYGDRVSLSPTDAQAAVNRITQAWRNAPPVVVLSSLEDARVPDAVRNEDAKQRAGGATGDPEGFFDKGTVYVVASSLKTPADVGRVLMHEALGHFGLRSVYGPRLGAVLDRVAVLNRAEVEAKAKEYGLDAGTLAGRRIAAEEVLAAMAEANPQIGLARSGIAAVRSWLRENIPGLKALRLTNDEITRLFLIPARAFVQRSSPSGRAAIPAGGIRTDPVFSRAASITASTLQRLEDTKLPAGYLVGDLFNSAGRISWWHKTVGSMHNLAERSPAFKKVYDAAQQFINDVSYYGNDAANLAPNILPKLEDFKDIAKSPVSAADTKALSAPVFEGTLLWGRDENGKPTRVDELQTQADKLSIDDKAHTLLRTKDITPSVLKLWQSLPIGQYETKINGRFDQARLKPGIVWTDAELRSQFNLTDGQIALYREFRAATDSSLSTLTKSEILRVAGKDGAAVREAVLAEPDIDKASALLRDHLFSLGAADETKKGSFDDAGNQVIDIANKAKGLIDRGYAPLSRFGEYTLDVVENGERKFFSLYESPRERSKAARSLKAEFPGATIEQGTISQEAFKTFAGVSPETVELFGEILGLDGNEAFAKYIRLTKSNRSTLKRLIQRKGIAGFSEDAGRVLAGFVYSNARKTSANLNLKAVDEAVTEIPQGQGQLKDAASRLAEYVKNPQEEAQAIRGLLFTQYLGGSVASAMVNTTQPFVVTFPYLSQFGGVAKSASQMTRATKDALKDKTGDKALDDALALAEKQGIVAPQEVFQLMGQAQGRSALKSGDGTRAGDAAAKASNALSKLSLSWGKVFSVAEQYNRRVTFIAAYRTAIDQGISDPEKFAAKTIADTQFVYNKASKPQWARGAVGGLLFTFKSYSIQYIELLSRLATTQGPEGKKAALLMLGVMFLLSGAGGLPFTDDIGDAVDGLMQRLGYNFSTKRAKKEFFANLFGQDGGRFVEHGLTGLPGVPIDLAGRLGMANLIPGTGLLTKSNDHTRDVLELVGPGGDLAQRAFQALGQVVDGNPGQAINSLAPTAARNIAKAFDMAQTGAYRDLKGRKVIDITTGDIVSKALGFQPNNVARVQEGTRLAQDLVGQTRLRQTELSAALAQAVYDKDADARAKVLVLRDRWNAKNPESRITINMASVAKQVSAMRQDKATRLANSSPKGIRQQVKRELESTQ